MILRKLICMCIRGWDINRILLTFTYLLTRLNSTLYAIYFIALINLFYKVCTVLLYVLLLYCSATCVFLHCPPKSTLAFKIAFGLYDMLILNLENTDHQHLMISNRFMMIMIFMELMELSCFSSITWTCAC